MISSPLAITGMHASGCEALGSLFYSLKFFDRRDQSNTQQSHHTWTDERTSNLHDQILASDEKLFCDATAVRWGIVDSVASYMPSSHLFNSCKDFLYEKRSHHKPAANILGWCDPRTTLLLDLWHDVDPSLKVIAVYREPWVTSQILKEIEPNLFLDDPYAALELWYAYNRRILSFKRHNPSQCFLIHASTIECSLGSIFDWTNLQFATAYSCENIQVKIKGPETQGYATWPYEPLYSEVYPAIYRCWKELNACADVPFHQPVKIGADQPLSLLNKTRNAKITILIPTYNQGHLLIDCIASVEESVAAAAIEADVEVIIINDGSNDASSVSVLQALQRLGYHLLTISNKGLANARNVGIRESKAPYILPIDDDNLLHSAYLTSGLEIIRADSNIAAVYGNREDFGLVVQVFKPGTTDFYKLLHMNVIDACALIRRTWLEHAGGYDISLSALEDWDLWLRILISQGKLVYFDKVCFSYCHRPSSMTMHMLQQENVFHDLVCRIRERYPSDL